VQPWHIVHRTYTYVCPAVPRFPCFPRFPCRCCVSNWCGEQALAERRWCRHCHARWLTYRSDSSTGAAAAAAAVSTTYQKRHRAGCSTCLDCACSRSLQQLFMHVCHSQPDRSDSSLGAASAIVTICHIGHNAACSTCSLACHDAAWSRVAAQLQSEHTLISTPFGVS
jgi:hypothetical protein